MELRSSSRADPVDGTNIFHTAVEIYGQNCFLHKKKVLDVRGFLYRHIRLHQNYRCVVEKVAIQALQFVSGPNPGSKTNQRNTVPQKWEALFLAVHLCQKYNLQNPAVVKPLMRSVLNFKDNVGSWDWRWFRILNPFAPVRVTGKDILYPFKPNGIDPFDEWPTDRHLEALEYFLKFAKFRFQTIQTGACNIVECPSLHDREDILWPNECDFIDCPLRILTGVSVPLAQACQSCNPKVVLFLLRHGATPVFKEELTYWKLPYTFIPEQPLDPILSMLNSCATWRCRSNAFPNIDRRLYASFEVRCFYFISYKNLRKLENYLVFLPSINFMHTL